ncbi:MAG: hypothetical protein R3E96_12675 [Planctomycetota bacterium]
MDKNLYLISFPEGPGTSFGDTAFGEQSLPQQIFSCVWELESQVNMSASAASSESAELISSATCGAPRDDCFELCTDRAGGTKRCMPGSLAGNAGGHGGNDWQLDREDQEATLNESSGVLRLSR